MRKPKTCFGCRSSWENDYSGFQCSLLYAVKSTSKDIQDAGRIYIPTPQESCPKPRTWKKYFNSDKKIS